MTMPCRLDVPADKIGQNGLVCSDTLSREGARELAQRLTRYWHDRGYPAVCFWAEPVDERFAKVGTYEIFRVACNLVNGLPPPHRAGSMVHEERRRIV